MPNRQDMSFLATGTELFLSLKFEAIGPSQRIDQMKNQNMKKGLNKGLNAKDNKIMLPDESSLSHYTITNT